MLNKWELANLIEASGVETTCVFNPSAVSTRLRNSVLKALKTGYCPTAQRSNLHQLCRALDRTFFLGLVYGNAGWGGRISFNHTAFDMDDDTRQQLLEVVQGHYAAEKLMDRDHRWSYDSLVLLKDMETLHGYMKESVTLSLRMPGGNSFRPRIAEVLGSKRNSSTSKRLKQAYELVASGTSIKLTL